jgi:hypothetical protein
MKKMLILALILFSVSPEQVTANDDLEDKISKATDESIDKDDELGQKDHNIKFLKMKAKSGKSSGTVQGKSGDANMNSVVMGAGSNVRGDIIIIDESKGDKVNSSGR